MEKREGFIETELLEGWRHAQMKYGEKINRLQYGKNKRGRVWMERNNGK